MIENEAFLTIWITLSVTAMSFVLGPILSCYLFKLVNTSMHPCYEIIEDDIKTEMAEKKSS